MRYSFIGFFQYLKINTVFLIIGLLTFVLFADTFLIKFYDLVKKNFIPITEKKILYSVIIGVCLTLELIVFNYTKKLIKKTKLYKKINFENINKIVYVSQVSIIILITIITFQIFLYNYYSSFLFMFIITLVLGVASFLIGRTILLFISWYNKRHNQLFLIYSISLSLILFNLVMTAIVLNLVISEKPEQLRQFVGGSMDLNAGKYSIVLLIFKISTILSFGSIWLTTALLSHISKDQLSHVLRDWGILSLPIIYFTFSYFAQDIFSVIFYSYLQSDPVNFSIILTSLIILSKPIGGLMFVLLFWRISKVIRFEKTLRYYMIISGFGFLLLLGSNQPTSLALGPFPPFGLASITILIVSAYLILSGIFVSANYLSTNTLIRKTIYNRAHELKLLDLIGTVEFEKEIEKTISTIVKQETTFARLEGINMDPDPKDLKDYLNQIINELEKK